MVVDSEIAKNFTTEFPSVPFADLHGQYMSIKGEIDSAIASVIASSAFVRGSFVEAFEQQFSEVIGIKHCVSCANGTDALYIAMRALGIKPGDEVITTAHSWISTSESITQAGGKVVFCDTDEETFTIDVNHIESLITPKTVGIVPVHLYGQAADMDPIMELADRHSLWVLEDCAQAHLATYKGRTVGTIGTAGTFSFYPGKNLGAMGDAGAIVTNDVQLAQRMSMFARHGGVNKGEHQIEGINSRMDGLQAAILSAKLPYLSEWTTKRQTIAQTYTEKLSGVPGLNLPIVANGRKHVWHLFVIRHDNRDELAEHLNERNIQTVINYPVALPFLPAYHYLAHKPEDFPVAFAMQSRILSLPVFAEMTDLQLEHVATTIQEICSPH